MPDTNDRGGDPSDEATDRATDEPADEAETDLERAEEIYEEVGAENPDPITRREAIEGELEAEGLSDAGEAIGEHNE